MSNDLLIEIGTEELPPMSLKRLAIAFNDNVTAALKEKEIPFSTSRWFATPRRLAVVVEKLENQGPDKEIESQGPPVAAAKDKDGNWTKAAIGFAKKNGVEPEQLEDVDTPKGKRLAYKTLFKGVSTNDCLNDVVNEALDKLPIPKRMRWGSHRAEFIRPVHWITILHGTSIVKANVFGIDSNTLTRGHRFHCDTTLEIANPAVYEKTLETSGHIIADYERRKTMIREQVIAEGKKVGGHTVIDEDLLDEVASLVEWPVALTGSFDERFLAVPAEALISSMKEHQKYFHIVNDKDELLPHFITISNIVSNDPSQVIAGNERVIRPRLADAAFFFETDKQQRLEDRVEKLKTVVFQQKLGTLYQKAERVQTLAAYISKTIGGDPTLAERAALLAKADLVSDMVLEFDKMQGIAGCYYALNDGEPEEVATAIKDQYLPKFAGDQLPESKTACALALADRLDTLVGIFGIGQPPTGSKDPFALRRASLGVLRIIVEKDLPLDLAPLIEKAKSLHTNLPKAQTVAEDVLSYMIERFRAWYEEDNIPVQLFQAVSAKNITVPVDFDNRVKAVFAFNQLEESAALAAANKRVSNILAKQDGTIAANIDNSTLIETAEKTLAAALVEKQKLVEPLFAKGNYTEGLTQLASLREPIDDFFDNVMVMADDEAIRQNRLALLSQLRTLFLHVADISLLA
ncbi:MAG: glycine--tRNA ligase subunit beta [Cellvibrionaceae bacterium]